MPSRLRTSARSALPSSPRGKAANSHRADSGGLPLWLCSAARATSGASVSSRPSQARWSAGTLGITATAAATAACHSASSAASSQLRSSANRVSLGA